jgi:hypothetical protein
MVLITLIGVSGCSPDALTAEEYSAYVADEDHGLRKSVSSGGATISVSYRPTDLLVRQTLTDRITPETIAERRRQYAPYLYFVLGLSAGNREALHATAGDAYSGLLQTLSFRMNDFITLTTSAGDTIPVGDFMLNRTYGMSASTDVLVVFSGEKARGKEWVQFNLNEFGLGAGNQRFRFDMKDLEDSPAVRFE